ncbi:MAG: response regulator [Sphingobacterium composti]|uniref:response regulator n=1 Tax=Sphingobacterium composti TaxID=363260 RepID=UPI00135C6BD8|nr:response regulator transcription factor [Sphingobacterium composti Ten et al. 2007 non Yoo et al. 2007]
MIRIVITDDHPLLMEGLKNILAQQDDFEIVNCYASSSDLFLGLKKDQADILLLDINLSDSNSLDIIEELIHKYPDMRIIMLSVHNEFAVINSALQKGAYGYIQKNANIEEIISGIEFVLQGKKFLCKQTKSVMDKKSQSDLKVIPKLTRREKEILVEAASGLTTPQIAEKLFISPHTVESHRKNLIVKFKTSNLTTAIKLALEYGIIRA